MQDEFKCRYTCPNCEARIRIPTGNCPNCGYIGQMEHRDIRLRGTNHMGTTVTVPPPKSELESPRKKDKTLAGRTAQYACPRCGNPTGIAHGRCSDTKACGYFGKMEPKIIK
jgi:predicted ATP-dependent serine protease